MHSQKTSSSESTKLKPLYEQNLPTKISFLRMKRWIKADGRETYINLNNHQNFFS